MNTLTNPKVAILLAEDFEKAEAIIIYKVLCHFQIEVHLLACQNQIIASNYQYWYESTCFTDSKKINTLDAIILPGGAGGTINLVKNTDVI